MIKATWKLRMLSESVAPSIGVHRRLVCFRASTGYQEHDANVYRPSPRISMDRCSLNIIEVHMDFSKGLPQHECHLHSFLEADTESIKCSVEDYLSSVHWTIYQ